MLVRFASFILPFRSDVSGTRIYLHLLERGEHLVLSLRICQLKSAAFKFIALTNSSYFYCKLQLERDPRVNEGARNFENFLNELVHFYQHLATPTSTRPSSFTHPNVDTCFVRTENALKRKIRRVRSINLRLAVDTIGNTIHLISSTIGRVRRSIVRVRYISNKL